MKNNTKLIMETWRRFLKEGTEGIDENGMVIEVSDEDDPSALPAVADTDLEGDIKTIDSMRKQNNQTFDDEYNPAGDMGDMDNMGEFNPYDSDPIPPEGLYGAAGDDDYVRVVAGRVGNDMIAAPLSRGAGVISSLVRSDGLVIIPRGTQGIPAGETVDIHLYRSPEQLENTIIAIGSHDMSLDLVAQFLANMGSRLVSSNIGSLGGLIALQRKEAHLAGLHLLDPQTGVYNLTYIKQYLSDEKIRLMGWVNRKQGLITRKENPKNIRSLQDLTRTEITFINRQRGAGTRILLDYQLQLLKIGAKTINGYDHEEYTHLAVAAAVSSGRADCGLGIAAAAQALGLDFIPLFDESYELAIPLRFINDGTMTPLLELSQNQEFRRLVALMPGYDITPMGKHIADLP